MAVHPRRKFILEMHASLEGYFRACSGLPLFVDPKNFALLTTRVLPAGAVALTYGRAPRARVGT